MSDLVKRVDNGTRRIQSVCWSPWDVSNSTSEHKQVPFTETKLSRLVLKCNFVFLLTFL